ncbi:right-handed parallel beta-helix repeat-containing protein [Cohnella herbarum]|uniref:Right-handed parallel beta-helix repeat-containing protein n=1 Tax=Cohnella herbarum TaxID=2728023 RepID=A0A7Z2VPK5_9BACL|nr:right-handed parallel beta-helix repeat-containing protein [Cohnella herbarum]QJD86821.1 right-handed parallel beta-helix repeat-containing protein [Cohnella herbarum]
MYENGIRDAASFGIEPDTGLDATGKIREFIRSGLESGAHTFRFKRGRYEIADGEAIRDFDSMMEGKGSWDLGDNRDSKHILIRADGTERIVLDFQGSTLMFHGLIQPFFFRGCKQVEIRNVQMDWARPPFSQGEIVSVHEEGFDIRFDWEYPVRSGTPISALIDYVPDSSHPIRGTVDWFHIAERTELVEPQTLRVTLKERFRSIARGEIQGRAAPVPGMRVVVRHVMNYKAAFLFFECEDVVMDRVTVYAAPGMGVIGHGCGDVKMRGLRIMRRPGSGRVMSANTDATHFIGCRGKIDFDDCLFEGMGDDATNVHGFYLTIRGRGGLGELFCGIDADIQSEYPEIPAVGDIIEVTRRSTLKPYATLTVSRVEASLSGEVALRFVEPLPEEIVPGDLLANVSRVAALRFRNSIVRNNRARAILVQTRHVEIADNTFDHCTGTAIHVNCADYWKESVATEDVTVTRNTFISCGYGAGTYRETSALALMTESESVECGVHRAFAFTDNVVYGNGRIGVSLGALSGGLLRGNRFENAGEAISIQRDTCEHIVVE